MNKTLLGRLKILISRNRLVRFLIAGGLNTAVTYLLYIALLQACEYRVAYTISYVLGIVLAFLVNRFFVFQTHRGVYSLVLFPLVYVVQYIAGLITIWVCVYKLGLNEALAPLIAIFVTIPLTYFISRLVFEKRPASGNVRSSDR